MKKGILKKVMKVIGGLFILLAIVIVVLIANKYIKKNKNLNLLGEEAPTLIENGQSFCDLNKNNKLDVYEDVNADIDDRLDDIISQMSIEEKAGTMFITMIGMEPDGNPFDAPFKPQSEIDFMINMGLPMSSDMIAKRKMNSFNIINSYEADILATFNNNVQKLAERTRLGIPITIATDPRHGTEDNPGAALHTPAFSQWPTSLGLAASRDTVMVREFGDIARQEYRAIGITLALHPMADLATEPRWGRINGTFGEDADLSAIMTKAYILGFQGDSLSKNSVACMVKHFSGGGPQKDGEDAHFPYGKEQVYPGNNFDYHVKPFIEGAFPANPAQIMPYYGIPIDQTNENVGFAFNKEIITELLRDSLNYDGVVCTDWNIISDSKINEARAWGIEHLTPMQRIKKALDAGCDQFGGEDKPELIVELVKNGEITEERIDESVRRILRDKFRLGLFDDPYVEVDNADKIVGTDAFRAKGKIAQGKSTVLLKNDNLLPLRQGIKVFTIGMKNTSALESYAQVVEAIEESDVLVMRIKTPFDIRDEFFLEQFFHQGRLYYSEEEKAELMDLINKKPTVLVVNLERPAILTEINEASKALFVEFGTSDEVLVDMLFGNINPTAKLPFELPSSWQSVLNQLEDVPYDSKDPLYPFGFGLSYQ